MTGLHAKSAGQNSAGFVLAAIGAILDHATIFATQIAIYHFKFMDAICPRLPPNVLAFLFFAFALQITINHFFDGKIGLLEFGSRILENLFLLADIQFRVQHIGEPQVIKRHHRPLLQQRLVAKIIFRMPYAAKWHEAVGKKINWSEAGVGPKYLESKLSMFRRKYWGMVAEAVKAALESKGAAR